LGCADVEFGVEPSLCVGHLGWLIFLKKVIKTMANAVNLSDATLMEIYADAMTSGVITEDQCERLHEALVDSDLTEHEQQALNRIFHSVWRGWLRYGDRP